MTLPDTITAGTTSLYSTKDWKLIGSASYVEIGAGYRFTVQKAGAYRIAFIGCAPPYEAYLKLQKNGADVAGSELTVLSPPSTKLIDVACVAGDVIKLWGRGYNAGVGWVVSFTVSILAGDLQTAINEVITVS